jgi:hypothetical protein
MVNGEWIKAVSSIGDLPFTIYPPFAFCLD